MSKEGLPVVKIKGNIPVLIDAPHAVRKTRDGVSWKPDMYTGAITEFLCEKTGAYGYIRCRNEGYDPNYERKGRGEQYRKDLGSYCKTHHIKLLIDLHGIDNSDIVCDIGTNHGLNLAENDLYVPLLKESLSVLGTVTVDRYFCASNKQNISRSISHTCEIPSIQIEVGSVFRKEPEDRKRFLNAIAKFLLLASLIEK